MNDTLRIPPQNLDAERSLLGSLLFLNDALDDVVSEFGTAADHFYSDSHQKIFDAFQSLRRTGCRGVDAVTLSEELQRRGELEDVGGLAYLAEVIECVPHAAHVRYYAQIVFERWKRRSGIYSATELLSDFYDDSRDFNEILERCESSLLDLRSVRDNHQAGASDLMRKTLEGIEARQEGRQLGLETGFVDLDQQTSGLTPTELIILAARPSMGKTAFAGNIAANIAEHSRVLLFSLEQSNEQLGERLLSRESRVNSHDIRCGKLTTIQRDELFRAAAALAELKLIIDDKPGRTISDIASIARKCHRRERLAIVIIDYLQLIEPEDRRQPREQQVSNISRRLKFLAKELDVPVLSLAQLNRGVELRENKRPKLADLRESGAIEQDADQVWFLHRDDAYDPEQNPGEAEVIVAKHRSGPTGMVRLTWQKEFMRFDNFCPKYFGEQ